MIATEREVSDIVRARLDDLTERYHAERARVESEALFSGSESRQDACPYCGRRWTEWVGAKNRGHVQCLVGADFKHRVRATWNSDPSLTLGMIADALGVTTSVVRAWIARVIADACNEEARKNHAANKEAKTNG